MININAYGGNWLHILLKTVLKMTGSFGCVVTSKQCETWFWESKTRLNYAFVIEVINCFAYTKTETKIKTKT